MKLTISEWTPTKINVIVPVNIPTGNKRISVTNPNGVDVTDFQVTPPATGYWDNSWPAPPWTGIWDKDLSKKFPTTMDVTAVDPYKSMLSIFKEGLGYYPGLAYAAGTTTDGTYPPLRYPPLSVLNLFWEHYKQVPKGYVGCGPQDSIGLALLANNVLRQYIGWMTADFWGFGKVIWSDEDPHGFNVTICYDGDIMNVHPYYWDVSMNIPPTLLKPDMVVNYAGYHEMAGP